MVVIKENTNLIDNSKYVDFYTVFEFPYSINDYSFKSEIRDEKKNLIATFVIDINEPTRQISLSLSVSQKTNVVDDKKYKYDIIETNASNKKRQVAKGYYIIETGISR